nr:reverse transcriptase domain-containing protein [Tanacetum cinerariifolium]
MTLELVDLSISRLVRVAEDVFIKVGTFHFPADFIVVDFDADPRVPLIVRRSFLKTGRDLIDVFKGELTLRVGKEAITFNLDQTPRYSANYNDMTANRIDVINMACEEYSQEVLGDDKLPVIIAKNLCIEEKTALITVLKSHKQAIAWKLSDIKGAAFIFGLVGLIGDLLGLDKMVLSDAPVSITEGFLFWRSSEESRLEQEGGRNNIVS